MVGGTLWWNETNKIITGRHRIPIVKILTSFFYCYYDDDDYYDGDITSAELL